MSRGHGTCQEVEWRSSIFISIVLDSPPHVRLVHLSHLYLKLAFIIFQESGVKP